MDYTQFEGHTPGPWKRGNTPIDESHNAICAGGNVIGSMFRRADVMLATAAPDLLEACTLALGVCEAETEQRGDNDTDDYDGGAAGPVAQILRIAIAKAQGNAA